MTSRQGRSEYARTAGRAVSKVAHAVKTGRLLRTDCVDCGALGLQAHHHNGYDPDHELDVVWLCRRCHLVRHGRMPKPPWERHARRYMVETRGLPDYSTADRTYSYSDRTNPKRLLWHVEILWGLLRTDEERAAMASLVERLGEPVA
jgi:hypothetical protein